MVPAVNDTLFPLEPTPDSPRGARAGRQDLSSLRSTPGPAAAAVAGRVAAGGASGPLRERAGGRGVGPECDPRRLHRGTRIPALRPAVDAQAAIYGYCTGQRSSRGIEKRCWDDVGFRYL